MNDYIPERLDNLLWERPSAGVVIAGDINQLDPVSSANDLAFGKS